MRAGAGEVSSTLTTVSCVSVSFCGAVGEQTNGVGAMSTFAEIWDGTSWALEQMPNPSGLTIRLPSVSCTSSVHCIAVGLYTMNGTQQATAELWDGKKWQVMVTPSAVPAPLLGVDCVAADDCTAVGADAARAPDTLVETWNGMTWTVVPSAAPVGDADFRLNSVSCPTATACLAVGQSNVDSPTNAAEVWDGTAWTMVPPLNPSGTDLLSSVSCSSPTACTAVGEDSVSPTELLVERYLP